MTDERGPANRWHKVSAVAARDYLSTVRTKAFILTLVVMPLLFVAALAVPLVADAFVRGELKRIAVIDRTGELLPALRTRLSTDEPGSKTPPAIDPLTHWGRPNLELVEEPVRADRDAHFIALSDRVRAGELHAFIELDAQGSGSSAATLDYHTQQSTDSAPLKWLTEAINETLTERRLRDANIDPQRVRELSRPVQVRAQGLYERDRPGPAPAPDPLREAGVPLALGMLLLMSVMLGTSPLMHSVLEEKMHRIAEILVTSVPPFQLMLGKLLGALGVAYTMLLTYGTALHLLSLQFGFGALLSASSVAILAFAAAAAVLTYGSVFLAVGSACNDLKEAQTLMLPVMVVITAPFLFLQLMLTAPDSAAAVLLSSLPFLSPILMALRLLLEPAPSWLHVGAAGAVTVITAWACVAAAARIFRIGMLTHGGIPSYRTLWQWLRQG